MKIESVVGAAATLHWYRSNRKRTSPVPRLDILQVPTGDDFLRGFRLGAAKLDLILVLVEENGLAIPGAERVTRAIGIPIGAPDVTLISCRNGGTFRSGESGYCGQGAIPVGSRYT